MQLRLLLTFLIDSAYQAKMPLFLLEQKRAKQELSNGFSNDHKTHPVINAIQLWQQNEPVARQTALSLLGYQLQRWMGFHGKATTTITRTRYARTRCPGDCCLEIFLLNYAPILR